MGDIKVNKFAIFALESTRRLYRKIVRSSSQKVGLKLDYQGQAAGDLIKEVLTGRKPCMISRLGSNELKTTLNYLDIASKDSILSKSIEYIRNEIGPFWWDDEIRHSMHNIAGFFPANPVYLERFAKTMLRDIKNIDVLGSWLVDEVRVAKCFPSARVVRLTDLEPYYHANPWSEVLEGKRVLVIHPFEESIKKQYAKHMVLFNDPRVLPKFELMTLKTVQSIAGTKTEFNTWFDALSWMCKKVRGMDFDIAIIGAGAYGLPLAAFIKSLGRKAIHLGGATQILFGIKGNRWDEVPFFRQLYNENWTRPLPEETPKNFHTVESGSYW